MARQIDRLTDKSIRKLTEPGMHADGGGLYLQLTEGNAEGEGAPPLRRSWIFRYSIFDQAKGRARTRDMGLGSFDTFGLAEARGLAKRCRQLRAEGKDPIAEREAQHAEAAAEAARALTFKQAAEAHIDQHSPSWRNEKHADQWGSTLEQYVYPTMGNVAAKDVDTEMVLKCLRPIWTEKPETAGRVRGRIESVLDGTIASGARPGPNPARWKGHLENLLPKVSRIRRIKHFASMPYEAVPAFVARLVDQPGDTAKALALVIQLALRTSEVIKAKVSEVDFAKALWTVPADRVKNRKELRVPLTPAAIEVLRPLCNGKAPDAWIFPGRRNSHLSDNAMLKLLERMSADTVTVHGFRSSFRDWAAERTNFGREISEFCLGHILGDQAELSYRRTDFLEKRRQLLAAWSRYVLTPKAGGDVVAIRA
jgi:integrase